MSWVVTKQRYHGELEPAPRYVVHEADELRGICVCWTAEQAQGLADLMNANSFRDPAPAGLTTEDTEAQRGGAKDWIAGDATMQGGAE